MNSVKMNRRRFLAASAVVARGAAAAPAAEWRNRRAGERYRRLGRTGFMVSEVCMGGVSVNPDNYEFVLKAADLGLNYLDTAPAYGKGKSEEGFGKVLKARGRDRFFVSTKVSPWVDRRNALYADIFASLPAAELRKLEHAAEEEIERRRAEDPDYFGDYFHGQRKNLRASILSNVMARKYDEKIDRVKNYKQLIFESVEASLRRLGTDHVDVITCPHGASSGYEVRRHPEIFEAFEELKKQGKARHLSVSSHSDPAGVLEAAMDMKVYSMAMVAFSHLNHAFFNRLLERAGEEDFGVLSMKAARPYFDRYDGNKPKAERVAKLEKVMPEPRGIARKAYAWALRNPSVAGVVAGLQNDRMVGEIMPLARG